jgi:hypothetical protein
VYSKPFGRLIPARNSWPLCGSMIGDPRESIRSGTRTRAIRFSTSIAISIGA